MKKKIVPAMIAVVLILVIIAVCFGKKIISHYTYSKEPADLYSYFNIQNEQDVPIILQDEIVEERAVVKDGVYYFDLDTVHKYFNERFYEDQAENLLIYTLPDDIIKNNIGTADVTAKEGDTQEDYVISYYDGDTLYVAADYVKKYTNFSYEVFTDPNRMQVYTSWEERQTVTADKDTAVREKGGIKSDILENITAGTKLYLLEEMETWSKVKTQDGLIGYVEKKKLTDPVAEQPIPVTDYTEPVYTSQTRDYKINMGWHVVAGTAGNETLDSVTANTSGLNVISPTWFKLSDNQGNFTSFATQNYVDAAHSKGLEVWGLVENIEYKDSIDMYTILSSTTTRAHLIDGLIDQALTYGLDGINVDFEQISMDAGEPFIEFIRELSIPCRENGLVLSVDNYVPTGYTDHYNRKEQGIVADYVVSMGYDEHYAGSEEAGSVASIDYVEAGIEATVAQVPADKVINAVPFYTRIWDTGNGSTSSQAVGMSSAQEYISAHNITTNWDETTCQNYGEYTEDGVLHQVWLEDAESIKVKLNVMSNYQIGGVASWRLGYETPDIWDVIQDYLNS